MDCQGFHRDNLEHIALQQRLDLQVARFELIRISQKLGLKIGGPIQIFMEDLQAREILMEQILLVLALLAKIPIFNYGQAARLRLYAEFRQAQESLAELEISIRSEVREAHKLLMSNLRIVNDFEGRLLPMQRKIVNSSEELYNVMGLGIDRLLESKRQEVITFKNYIESKMKYLVAQVELDRAMGGYLYLLMEGEDLCSGVCK